MAATKFAIPSVVDGLRVPGKSMTIFAEFCEQLTNAKANKCEQMTAITDPSGRNISYVELSEMVSRCCSCLRQDLQKHRPVCVFLPPSCSRIGVLLALNSLGIPFVPLDYVQTAQQREFIIANSKAQAVITDDSSALLLNNELLTGKVSLIVVDQDCNPTLNRTRMSDEEVKGQCEEDVCCILFTSGSTGIPKGIKLTNANFMNRLRWQWAELPFAADGSDVCLAKTNPLFVDSYTEVLGAVLRLQNLVIVDLNEWKKIHSTVNNIASLIAETISRHKVTRLILVPSLLRALLEEPEVSERLVSLLLVISSGEALSLELACQFFHKISNQPKLANFYGSTEVTGDITAAIFSNEADVRARSVDNLTPIGRPIYNTTVYVVREDSQKPVPLGEVGRIFVSGDNVCQGFVNDKQNMDDFYEKPSLLSESGCDGLLFYMGDLGKVNSNGELLFCGRSDSIAKVRGNRVSTLQVEEALKEVLSLAMNDGQHDEMPKCRVLAVSHQKSATQRLAAFYEQLPQEVIALRPDNVRKALSNRLPKYAIPELLFPLEAGTFPLQPQSGKCDQRALKRIAEEACNRLNVDVESALAKWTVKNGDLVAITEAVRLVAASTLGIDCEQVIMKATFFNQGGNSLSVIAAVAALRKAGLTNATAEMLLSSENTLDLVALHLSNTFSTNKPKEDVLDSVLPPWLEFLTFANLSVAEKIYVQARFDLAFATNEPLTVLLGYQPQANLELVPENWTNFEKSGPLSFVAVDKRIVSADNGVQKIVGGCFNADLLDEETEEEYEGGLEPIFHIVQAVEKPVKNELLKEFGMDEIPPGFALSSRLLYADNRCPDNQAAVIFLEMEKEVIRRAKTAGYKRIISVNSSIATQMIDRDLLGYKERNSVYASKFEMPDGSRPFSNAPSDYAVVAMALDI